MSKEIVGYVSERGDTYCPPCASMASMWGLLDGSVNVYAESAQCYVCDDCGTHLAATGILECAANE